jgi:hypothetical protein
MENSFDSSTCCSHSTTDGHSPGPRVSSLAGFQGQTKEAYEIIARMHAGGDRTSSLVEFEMEEMMSLTSLLSTAACRSGSSSLLSALR